MSRKLKLKVCGMRQPENIAGLGRLKPDFAGLIFYEKSPRFAGGLTPGQLSALPETTCRTGVFVKHSTDGILQKVEALQLGAVQLHGDESPEFCSELRRQLPPGTRLIKVLRVDEDFDFSETRPFEEVADYFLFDTRAKGWGGTGKTFNWQILQRYQGKRPFFLSGGIGPAHAKSIAALQHPRLFAVDINSGFEVSPGLKDLQQIREFGAFL